MTQQTTTRDAIIMRGAQIIHARGFNATGLQRVLDGAGVPKGSFYFYFKSKEDFGLAIVDHFADVIGALFSGALDAPGVPALERLGRLFDAYERIFAKSGFTLGCPLGNLSLEMADSSERFRARLQEAIDSLIARIESCLAEAKRAGALHASFDTGEAARLLFQGLEGAILHMKVTKNAEPLKLFRKYISRLLEDAAPAGRNTMKKNKKGGR
jgi:TetR/AcrR family transcriptional regulator, transcriptional repressor for nem operon